MKIGDEVYVVSPKWWGGSLLSYEIETHRVVSFDDERLWTVETNSSLQLREWTDVFKDYGAAEKLIKIKNKEIQSERR